MACRLDAPNHVIETETQPRTKISWGPFLSPHSKLSATRKDKSCARTDFTHQFHHHCVSTTNLLKEKKKAFCPKTRDGGRRSQPELRPARPPQGQ